MTGKNEDRLLSSVHSAVTSRKHRRRSLPKVSRRKHMANSARSMVIIHAKIRPSSTNGLTNRNKNIDDLNTFPSVRFLILPLFVYLFLVD